MNDYYVPWFDFLAHEVNPEEVCSVVGLCGANAAGFLEVGEEPNKCSASPF